MAALSDLFRRNSVISEWSHRGPFQLQGKLNQNQTGLARKNRSLGLHIVHLPNAFSLLHIYQELLLKYVLSMYSILATRDVSSMRQTCSHGAELLEGEGKP